MLFSYNWLKKHVPDLPEPEKLEDGIIFHAFEVEGLAKAEGDWTLDIKVLPDRAHDCLCHLGIAREAAAIFDLPLTKPIWEEVKPGDLEPLLIRIEDEKACRRYVGRRVNNVAVFESPDWLKKSLAVIGQRSINSVVDIANYVMFDLGQPLHAFDADKVEGGIKARFAKPGEKIITLDGDEVALDESIFIIADDVGPLAIAGIKGGQKAGVTKETKNLILEAANFDPVLIRKIASKIKLKTDASKRFENELARETASEAMKMFSAMLKELVGGEYGEVVDVYPAERQLSPIKIKPEFISQRLGVTIPEGEIKKIFSRLGLDVKEEDDGWLVAPPFWRLDLTEEVNLVEEIGRIFGYEGIKPEILPPLSAKAYRAEHFEQQFLVANLVRRALFKSGFTEVYGYAFTDHGEVKVENPLAADKAFLRANLIDWLGTKLKENLIHVIFDDEPVKIFEIGTVFPQDGWEEMRLAIGLGYRKKIKGTEPPKELEMAVASVAEAIGWSGNLPRVTESASADGLHQLVEFNFEKMVDMAGPVSALPEKEMLNQDASYRPVSPYPRIIRDVAVWVPADMGAEQVGEIIIEAAGELLLDKPILFDEFKKEGRKSLAFRLVLQSYEKTLSDGEANKVAEGVIGALEKADFEVRK